MGRFGFCFYLFQGVGSGILPLSVASQVGRWIGEQLLVQVSFPVVVRYKHYLVGGKVER